ncbi:MAG: TIGR01244 family sulfur transferase [Pseudomonadota bacterium]
MDIRPLTPAYAVSPQIDPEDLPVIAEAGFTTVIDNRPDMEIPPSHRADVMEAAAQKAGLAFVVLPVTHQGLTLELVAQQAAAVTASEGPVLAYCASGTRCTIVWALAQARGGMPSDAIIAAAAAQGYDITMLRNQLETLAEGRA